MYDSMVGITQMHSGEVLFSFSQKDLVFYFMKKSFNGYYIYVYYYIPHIVCFTFHFHEHIKI